MSNQIITSGRRKRAIARAVLQPGKGIVRINSVLLEQVTPKMYMQRIYEPLLLAEGVAKKVNIAVKVEGGGPSAQCDASRLAIARALAQFDKKLESTFQEYDRTLLVADVRFKESSKPNCMGRARAKRQKSYR